MRSFQFLLLFFSMTAFADPLVKQGQVGLAANSTGSSLAPGAEIVLDIIVPEKIGDASTTWHLDTQSNSRWIPYGDLSVNRETITAPATSENLTKIEFTAMLIGSGDISIQKLRLLDSSGKFAIEASGPVATKVASNLTEQDKKQTNWILDPIAIGGWNQWLLILIALLLVLVGVGIIFFIVKMLRRRKKEKQLNAKERALAEISRLQAFARGGSTRSREEWKQFSYGLAHVLRSFCEDLYHFPTHDLTDRELLDDLRPHTDKKQFLDDLSALLKAMDSARYGQQESDTGISAKLLVDSKQFVETLFEHEMKKQNAAKEAKK